MGYSQTASGRHGRPSVQKNLKSLADSLIHGYASLLIRRRAKSHRSSDIRAQSQRRSVVFNSAHETNEGASRDSARPMRDLTSGSRSYKRDSVSGAILFLLRTTDYSTLIADNNQIVFLSSVSENVNSGELQ